MSESLLEQIGQRARARDAAARRIEASLRESGSTTTNATRAASIAAAIDASRPRSNATSASAPAPVTPANVKTRGPKIQRASIAASAFVATFAAAAAVLLAVRATPGATAPMDYTVSVNGHVETTRAVQSVGLTTLEAREDAMQEVVVRPREAASGTRAASVLVVRDGARVPASITPEVSELGAVRFDVPGAALRNATELVVVITAADARTEEIRIPVEPRGEKDPTPR